MYAIASPDTTLLHDTGSAPTERRNVWQESDQQKLINEAWFWIIGHNIELREGVLKRLLRNLEDFLSKWKKLDNYKLLYRDGK